MLARDSGPPVRSRSPRCSSSARGSLRNLVVYSPSRDSSRARTCGTPSTVWWAISCRQIHNRRSSAGRLHSWPNSSRLRHQDDQLVGRRTGDRQVVLPERAAGQVADHRPGGHRHHHRLHGLDHRAEHGGELVVAAAEAGSGSSRVVERRRPPCRATPPASRGGAGSPSSVRCAQWPRVTGTTVSSRPVTVVDRPGDVGDVQLGHPGELFELDALEGVDVGLAGVLGGDRQGQVAGRIPWHAAAALAEQLGQVAEQGEALEGVGRAAGHAHLTRHASPPPWPAPAAGARPAACRAGAVGV